MVRESLILVLLLSPLVFGVSCPMDGSGATYTETLSVVGTTQVRGIAVSGCPNHYNLCVSKPNCANGNTDSIVTSKSYQVMAKPVLMTTSVDNSCMGGAIAVALNGVAIFNSATKFNPCSLLNLSDPNGEWISFDKCSGHSSPDGEYHYHFPPSCLLNAIPKAQTGHSPQIGWHFDGFPIYGPLGPNGVQMITCAKSNKHAPYCTDACGGLEMELPWLDGFKYRYYLQGNVSDMASNPSFPKPTADYYPFTTACRRGCLYTDYKSGSCTGATGTNSTYVAAKHSGYTAAVADVPTCSDYMQNGDELGMDCGGSCPKACTSTGTTCKTSSGPRSGSSCVFPFTYKGVKHTSCTKVDDTKAWCATSTDSSGNYVAGNYGYCPSTCTAEADCAASCKYYSKTFTGCTTTGDTKPWCCTTTSSGSYVSGNWRYCTAGTDVVTTTSGTKCTASCKYQGTTFYGCTSISSSTPWCCTETTSDGSYIYNKWGYCA